jgi:hypothetical protein
MLIQNVQAQKDVSEYIGKYGDYILANGESASIELELKPDKTFKLREGDYTNEGNRLVMYMPFSAWYDSGFTRGLLLPFFR